MTPDDSPGRLARVALGRAGFERAAVWSAVGFALSYVAFDAAALLGAASGPIGSSALVSQVTPALVGPIALALVALTALGVAAFAATGGGLLPSVLLAYGPVAAVLLRTTGPEPYALPVADPLPFVVRFAGSLGAAVAVAVAAGAVGYAVGRTVAGIGDGGDGESAAAADSDSTAAADGD